MVLGYFLVWWVLLCCRSIVAVLALTHHSSGTGETLPVFNFLVIVARADIVASPLIQTLGFIFIRAPLEALFHAGCRAVFFARWFFGAVLLVSFAVLAGCFVVQFVRLLGLVAVWVCGVCMRSAFRLFFWVCGVRCVGCLFGGFP